MGTSNYHTYDCEELFAIELEYDEENEEYIDSEFIYEDIADSIKYELESICNKKTDIAFIEDDNIKFNENRNFPISSIGKLYTGVSFLEEYSIDIEFKLGMSAGYYVGACLMYELCFINNATGEEHNSVDDFLFDIEEYYIDTDKEKFLFDMNKIDFEKSFYKKVEYVEDIIYSIYGKYSN